MVIWARYRHSHRTSRLLLGPAVLHVCSGNVMLCPPRAGAVPFLHFPVPRRPPSACQSQLRCHDRARAGVRLRVPLAPTAAHRLLSPITRPCLPCAPVPEGHRQLPTLPPATHARYFHPCRAGIELLDLLVSPADSLPISNFVQQPDHRLVHAAPDEIGNRSNSPFRFP